MHGTRLATRNPLRFQVDPAQKLMDRILKECIQQRCGVIEIGPVYWYAVATRFCFNVVMNGRVVMRPSGLIKVPLIQRFHTRNNKKMRMSDGTRFSYSFHPGDISLVEVTPLIGATELRVVDEPEPPILPKL